MAGRAGCGVLRFPEQRPVDPTTCKCRIQRTAARLRAQQIASLLRYTPYMLLANVMIAMILVVAFLEQQRRALGDVVQAWVSPSCRLSIHPLALDQKTAATHERLLPGATRAILNAAILGSIWAVPPIAFVFDGWQQQQSSRREPLRWNDLRRRLCSCARAGRFHGFRSAHLARERDRRIEIARCI